MWRTLAGPTLLVQGGLVGGDEDLYGGFIAVNEGVEALVDEVVDVDLARDKRREVELAGLYKFDGLRVVTHVADGAANVELLEYDLLHVDLSLRAPDGHDDQGSLRAKSLEQHIEHGLDGGSLEVVVSTLSSGEFANLLDDVDLLGAEGVVGGAGI